MKPIAYVAIFALFLIGLATPRSTHASVSGPSASGNFKFVLEDGLTKQVEFDASWDERGTTTGRMTFRDEAGTIELVDAEDPRDEGAYAHWWATDAEREDDRGIESVNIIPGSRQGCPTFLLSTYEFPEARGEGQIQVLQ